MSDTLGVFYAIALYKSTFTYLLTLKDKALKGYAMWLFLVRWDVLWRRNRWSVSWRHWRLFAAKQWTHEAACHTVWTASEENVCCLFIISILV